MGSTAGSNAPSIGFSRRASSTIRGQSERRRSSVKGPFSGSTGDGTRETGNVGGAFEPGSRSTGGGGPVPAPPFPPPPSPFPGPPKTPFHPTLGATPPPPTPATPRPAPAVPPPRTA